MSFEDGYIAVDWGTTNRRAYLVDASAKVIDQFEDECGLMSVPCGGFEASVAEIRTRLGDRVMLMAGMVGSNRGWREAPYVPCPAGAEALAAAILWVEPGRTGIVPGVSQKGEKGADVMRGEEVQLLGAVAAGMTGADGLVCHPGTHAKWVEMKSGRIEHFRTMMTGEIFSLLTNHSILADQLAGKAEVDEDFRQGARDALGGANLLSSLFAIRARFLLDEAKADEVSYASGLLIGSDVRAGLAHHPEGRITLMGRPDLCALYAEALAQAGRESDEVDGAAAFLAGIHHLTEIL